MTLGGMVRNRAVIGLIVAVQALCAIYYTSGLLLSVLGIAITPIPWALHEYLEIGVALAMLFGVVFGAAVLHGSARERRRAEEGIRRMRGDFRAHLEQSFERWGLTPAEAEVAVYAIKGLRTQEIAHLRNTSEGTVKAQTNAIYRKARVTGRSQLLSLFIGEMMEDGTVVPFRAAEEPAARAA